MYIYHGKDDKKTPVISIKNTAKIIMAKNSSSSNNNLIVKNTAFLYFRMIFSMGITLYTSRLILTTLGIEDFGIYNVIEAWFQCFCS